MVPFKSEQCSRSDVTNCSGFDKLAALYNGFVAHGMLPPRYYAALPTTTEAENVDGGLVDKERVTAHVIMACSPGK